MVEEILRFAQNDRRPPFLRASMTNALDDRDAVRRQSIFRKSVPIFRTGLAWRRPLTMIR